MLRPSAAQARTSPVAGRSSASRKRTVKASPTAAGPPSTCPNHWARRSRSVQAASTSPGAARYRRCSTSSGLAAVPSSERRVEAVEGCAVVMAGSSPHPVPPCQTAPDGAVGDDHGDDVPEERGDMTTRTAPPSVRPRLVAACWTWAGDAEPGRPGPADIDDVLDRVRAASGAGWDGLGFHDHDLATVRETIGFPGLREVLRDAGIDIVEVEFLDDWWRADADPGIEALLLDAAVALGARLIKAGVPSHEELADIGAEVVASRLARLGDRAGQSGTQVALEAMGEPGTLDITEVIEDRMSTRRNTFHLATWFVGYSLKIQIHCNQLTHHT